MSNVNRDGNPKNQKEMLEIKKQKRSNKRIKRLQLDGSSTYILKVTNNNYV